MSTDKPTPDGEQRPHNSGHGSSGGDRRPRREGDGERRQWNNNRDDNRGGGYRGNRDDNRGGYQGNRSGGGYNRDDRGPRREGDGERRQWNNRNDNRGGGYRGNRDDNRSGGYQGNRSGGGYNRDDRGPRREGDGERRQWNNNRDDNRGGGYRGNRDDNRGGYQGNRSGGGYNRDDRGPRREGDGERRQWNNNRDDNRGGGYRGNRDDNRGGGYRGNRDDNRGGGYRGNRDDNRGGGYRGNRDDNRSGGYQANRSGGDRGGYQGNRSGGGYNRDDRGPRREGDGERRQWNNNRDDDRQDTRKPWHRAPQDREEYQAHPGTTARADEPGTPDGFDANELPMGVRAELKGLPKDLAETVGAHIWAAGRLIDEDPEQAFRHAEAARRRAGRLPVVREAAALTAYAAGEYAVALREFRALRRMNGGDELLPVIADCERALGRPRDALEVLAELDPQTRDIALRIEALLVESGIRDQLGQRAEALRLLKAAIGRKIGSPYHQARLRYAYANLLEESGDKDGARQWFTAAAQLDYNSELDTSDRIAVLDGVVLPDDFSLEEETEDDAAEELVDESEAVDGELEDLDLDADESALGEAEAEDEASEEALEDSEASAGIELPLDDDPVGPEGFEADEEPEEDEK